MITAKKQKIKNFGYDLLHLPKIHHQTQRQEFSRIPCHWNRESWTIQLICFYELQKRDVLIGWKFFNNFQKDLVLSSKVINRLPINALLT